MKKFVFITLIITCVNVLTFQTYACDYCNCYLGLNPSTNKNFVGLRYKNSAAEYTLQGAGMRVQHDHGDEPITTASGDWNGNYNTFELYGQAVFSPFVRALVFVPYSYNNFSFASEQASQSSLGDATLLIHTQLFNTMDMDSTILRHRVFIGGGIKFATGTWEPDEDFHIPFAHHLPSGTGSTDLMLSTVYIGKYRNIGWSVDLSYKFNFENPDEYRYGNTFNTNLFLFYSAMVRNKTLMPYVCSGLEVAAVDNAGGMEVDDSGGTILWTGLGTELYLGAVKFNAAFNLPTLQDVNGEQPKWNHRIVTSVSYNF